MENMQCESKDVQIVDLDETLKKDDVITDPLLLIFEQINGLFNVFVCWLSSNLKLVIVEMQKVKFL